MHSHVFEHIYNPLEFLKDISEYLEENELQILSIPNLPRYLESRFSNTINFEHTFYFTEEIMDYMFSASKFEIVDKLRYDTIVFFTVLRKTYQSNQRNT